MLPRKIVLPNTHGTHLGKGAINRLYVPAPVSGMCVMPIWHRIRLVPAFYSKPESGVHATEMVTYNWSMIIVNMFSCCNLIANYEFIVFTLYSHVYFRRQKFSSQAHYSTRNRRRN